jgi:hypothetical protein
MMQLKPGTRWRSAVSDVEVVVVRPPKSAGVLACGGVAMLAPGAARAVGAAAPDGQCLVGKRYEDPESGLEALCAKGGAGVLAFEGRTLTVKEARKLPSSD